MNNNCIISVLLLTTVEFLYVAVDSHDAQRLPPGVAPSQYQQPHQHQPPPPQQQQQQYQQPQHQQQQQFQQQQQRPAQPPPPPPQHQQQQNQVPQHGAPQHGAPHHHDPNIQPQQLLNAANIAQEKDHIQEHLHVPIDTSKMTEQELQFHYFKMHDADNNNKLDGCELIKSLIHWHEQGHKDPATGQTVQPQEKLFKDDELIQLIDPILNMDDSNGDGYIDYPEFVRAQQKAVKRSS